METATRQRIDTLLAARAATDAHRATVQRELQEDWQRRHQAQQSRAVRSITLSGHIRR